MYLCILLELADSYVRQDVEVHGKSPGCAGTDDRARRHEGAKLQGQVRVLARVDDERISQPARAVQHDEDRQRPRLEGIRRRHASQLTPPVSPLYMPSCLPTIFAARYYA